jgi:hypothetical protein
MKENSGSLVGYQLWGEHFESPVSPFYFTLNSGSRISRSETRVPPTSNIRYPEIFHQGTGMILVLDAGMGHLCKCASELSAL